MRPDRRQATIHCNNRAVGDAPRCAGVYRFFNADNVLLYVGKSIDISTRLNSHYAEAREPGRQQQMMSAVRRVDCELTAGEIGALLLENAAIKEENPLYNRRQRRQRKLWTLRLSEDPAGFLRVTPSDFCAASERLETVFGLFRSQTQLQKHLRSAAREQGLCLRRLGVERGTGPCFQHQVGRCRGACSGRESAPEHNARLLASLEQQRIAAWPFSDSILLEEERRGPPRYGQPRRQFHLLDHWSYVGSFRRRDSARSAAAQPRDLTFDRDAYHIAYRALRLGSCRIRDPVSGAELGNPYALAGSMAADSSAVQIGASGCEPDAVRADAP